MRKGPTALDVDNLRANMMAIKSFLMNEIYDLRQEISSLQLKLQQKKLNQSGNNDICEKDKKIIIEDLKNQIRFLSERKSAIKRRDDGKKKKNKKKRRIETILYQCNEILKLDQYYNKNIEQETIVSKAGKKVKTRVKETNYWIS